jgi:hypothetical protein
MPCYQLFDAIARLIGLTHRASRPAPMSFYAGFRLALFAMAQIY